MTQPQQHRTASCGTVSHTHFPPRCRKTKKSANCTIFRQYGRFFLFTFYLPSGNLLFPFRFKYFTHEELLHLFSESIKQAKQCVSEIVLKSCNGVWLFFFWFDPHDTDGPGTDWRAKGSIHLRGPCEIETTVWSRTVFYLTYFASVLCPTSSKSAVASLPANSISTSSPPGCYTANEQKSVQR